MAPCARGLRVEGEYCREIEFAPQTTEGRLALAACSRAGVWKRAGMGGAIVGLDLNEALATVAALGGEPGPDILEYLGVLEGAAIEATAPKAAGE